MILALKILQENVWGDSVLEYLGLLSLFALGGGAWHHIACHKNGCHRLGRFTHGHYKLCHIHHPDVPNDGKIHDEHIAAVTVANLKSSAKRKPAQKTP